MWASYDPDAYEDERHTGGSLEEARDLGLLYVPAEQTLAFVDPLPDETRPEGEGPNGIDLRLHPNRLLEQCPRLWGVIDRYRTGVVPAPVLGMSNFETISILLLRAADGRAEKLRAEVAAGKVDDG